MSDSADRTPAVSPDQPDSGSGQTLPTFGGSAGPPTATDPGSTQTVTTPRVIAGYEIERELGRGGMGVVYLARQRGLNRLVALKMILHADHAGSEDRVRFLREAEALAKLRHENIVQVYDIGEIEGKPYFSLEYIDGGSLDKHLHGTPLLPLDAAALVEKLARAVQTAHDAGIIHRDLKPANILLQHPKSHSPNPKADEPQPCSAGTGAVPVSDFGFRISDLTPKVTDFGLAKQQDAAGLSVSGAVLGTPSYMAPEQAAGRTHEVGPAADIYALGAILYDCLTGRPPFKAATVADTLLQVLQAEPVAPRQLNTALPPDLETICLKCLHKEPARRYASAQELAEDLRRFQAGEPILARPVGRAERVWRWCKRNPTTARLIAAVVFLLIGGTTVSSILAVIAEQRRDEAEQSARQERIAKERASDLAHKERDARADAEKEKAIAEDERDRTRRQFHLSRVTLAQREWDEGHAAAARDALQLARGPFENWEYRYLHRLFYYQNHHVFAGHVGRVSCVTFSPDGSRIASCGADRSIRIWEPTTGAEVRTWKTDGVDTTWIAFSPDGRLLASVGRNRAVTIWDAGTGTVVHTLAGVPESPLVVRCSPDGKRLLVGGTGGVEVWDLQTGRKALAVPISETGGGTADFSPDGRRIVITDGTRIRLLDAETGNELSVLARLDRFPFRVRWSPDGSRISAVVERAIKLWDVRTGRELHTLKGHRGSVTICQFSPDGRRLVSGSSDTTLVVWDVVKGEPLFALKGHTEGVSDAGFSADGQRIVSAGADGLVLLWDARNGQDGLVVRGGVGSILSVAFTPDGKRVVAGGGTGPVLVCDAATGDQLLLLTGPTRGNGCVDVSRDGQRIAAGNEDRRVRIWDAASGQLLRTIQAHLGRVAGVRFSPDGKQIVTAGDRELKLWDVETGSLLATLRGHTDTVYSVAFSSDGKTLVSGGADRTVRLWDVDTGTMIARIEGQRGTVSSVAFSPDDALIASASMDSTLALWDRKGRQLHSLVGHTSTVYSAAFSPDGKRLVSAGEDRTIRLWDVETGRETLLLKGHANIALCAAFSPDGQRLASGSHDMTLRLWDANDDREALTLRGHVGMATAVAVSPDDRTIATAGIDGVIKLWDVRLGRVEVVLTGHVQSQPDRFRKANPIRRLAFDAEGRRLFSEDQEGAKRYWDVVTGRALGEQDEADFIVPQGKLSVRVDPSAVHVRSQPTAGDLALLKRWAEPDAAWHEMLGQAAEKEADWFASAFHLRHVVSARKSDASLHIRLAYALARTGDAGSAARHYLQAVLLDPAVRLWPDNPFAWSPAREAAQEGQWQRAGDDYRLAVEQRSPDLATWEGYLLCALAAGRRVEAAEGLRLFLERMTPVTAAKEQYKLVRVGRVVPCGPGEAQKLLAIARSDVAAQRSSSALDFLGAALYRAGQYQPAIDALLESIKLDGDGGYVESWVFLAMAYQRLGNASEARRWLGRYQDWYRRARLDTWPLQTRYRLLHDEASALVETMPRSTDP